MTATQSGTLASARSSLSDAQRAAPACGTDARRLAGRYRYDRRADTWSWSPEMSALLGHSPAAGRPCSGLLVRSLHPGDRPPARGAIDRACTGGVAFALRVRLGRRGAGERTALLIGEPVVDAAGAVEAVDGLLVELPPEAGAGTAPDPVHALETEVAQLRTAMASRAAIEQAKGILMLLNHCSDQVAFDLLAHISSNTHRKVRDVAVAIVGSAAGHAGLPEDIRTLIQDVCPPRPRP